jgi:hypothetical protein
MNPKTLAIIVSVAGIVALVLLFRSGKTEWNSEFISGRGTVYIVYSPTCPHCHTLIEYVRKAGRDVNVITTTGSSAVAEVFSEYGVSWDYGVPVMFGLADDSLILLRGFPSDSQFRNGYLVSKEYEQNLCALQNGTAAGNSESYKFCILGGGQMMGNAYSADAVLSFCEERVCEFIPGISSG